MVQGSREKWLGMKTQVSRVDWGPLLFQSPLLFMDVNFVPVNASAIVSCLADNKLPEAGVLYISHFSSKCPVQC